MSIDAQPQMPLVHMIRVITKCFTSLDQYALEFTIFFILITYLVDNILYKNCDEKSHFHHNDTAIQVPTDSTSLGSLGKGHAHTEANIL